MQLFSISKLAALKNLWTSAARRVRALDAAAEYSQTLGDPAFDMVVIGCGGGPDETNLSAYLLKPYNIDWEDGIVAIEAGSGLGTLRGILRENPTLFGIHSADGTPQHYTAQDIYSLITSFLITHGHLDHINGLVLSAGSYRRKDGRSIRISAAQHVLDDIQLVFSDRLWPNLATWDQNETNPNKFVYSPIALDETYHTLTPAFSVCAMPLSHGMTASPPRTPYHSTVFFIRHDASSREFLFFGDVEPDAFAHEPLTQYVWRAAAPKITCGNLNVIFIECSWTSERNDSLLFGHLKPQHLITELTTLARFVCQSRGMMATTEEESGGSLRNALVGLKVYIMHCKDGVDASPPSSMSLKQTPVQSPSSPAPPPYPASRGPMYQVITGQVHALMEESGLGAQILPVEQGTRITF